MDLTGVGTLVLAGATLCLVGVTIKQVSYTRKALERGVRPLLADDEVVSSGAHEWVTFGAPGRETVQVVPGGLYYNDDDGTLQLSVSFRNVGAGAALITGAELDPPGGDVHLSQMLVPVGGRVRVNVSAHLNAVNPHLAASVTERGHVAVLIDYVDTNGGQRSRTRAEVQVFATMGPVIEAISLEDGGGGRAATLFRLAR